MDTNTKRINHYCRGGNERRLLPIYIGAVIGYAILSPFLTPALLSSSLAFVAGIMVYISLDEILPLAHRYGKEHVVLVGIGAGMLVMALSLFLLR